MVVGGRGARGAGSWGGGGARGGGTGGSWGEFQVGKDKQKTKGGGGGGGVDRFGERVPSRRGMVGQTKNKQNGRRKNKIVQLSNFKQVPVPTPTFPFSLGHS